MRKSTPLTTVLKKEKLLFESKYLPKHERWILPLFVLCGLVDARASIVDLSKLSEMMTPIDSFENDLLHKRIQSALSEFAQYVDPENPNQFLAVLTSGTYGMGEYGEPEDLEWFYDTPLMEKYDIDEYGVNKFLYLGKNGLNWYEETEQVFKKLLKGYDLDLFNKVFAITSPATDFRTNLINALRAYDLFKRKKTFKGSFLPAIVSMLNDLRSGDFLSGENVRGKRRGVFNFYRALSGDKNAVVVDTRVLEACGLLEEYLWRGKRRQFTPRTTEYDFIEEYITTLASVSPYEPRRVVSMLWTGVKSQSRRHWQVNTKQVLTDALKFHRKN